jgi:hypothetical protein
MKLGEFIKLMKNVSSDAELLIFPKNLELEDEETGEMKITELPGIGYYDPETSDFVYLGIVNEVNEEDE